MRRDELAHLEHGDCLFAAKDRLEGRIGVDFRLLLGILKVVNGMSRLDQHEAANVYAMANALDRIAKSNPARNPCKSVDPGNKPACAQRVLSIPRKPMAKQTFLPAGFHVEEWNQRYSRECCWKAQPDQSPAKTGKHHAGVEGMPNHPVDPALNKFGVLSGLRKRGEVSAKRYCPGDSNASGNGKNQRPDAPPSHRTGTRMPQSEQENACEKDKLSNNPASPTFQKSNHRSDGNSIHRVQIRGAGDGFRKASNEHFWGFNLSGRFT